MRKIFKTKFFLLAVVPSFLLLLWGSLTIVYIINLDTAFSILSYNESNASFTNVTYGKLTKGKSITGEFIARDNNLGIIAIRFQTFFRPSYVDEDKLLFQLKERGSKNWYYEQIYRNGLIYDLPFFPFGFPIIQNSEGKQYEFKITSLNGNSSNSVAIDNKLQVLTTKYKYTKSQLLKNKTALITFTAKKFINSFQSINVLYSSIVYLLPFTFYLLIYIIKKQEKRNHYSKFNRILPVFASLNLVHGNISMKEKITAFILLGLLVIVACIDISYLQLQNDMVYLIYAVLWFVLQRSFGLSAKLTFGFAIFFFTFAAVFSIITLTPIAEEFLIYAYLFLVDGVMQILAESSKAKKNQK